MFFFFVFLIGWPTDGTGFHTLHLQLVLMWIFGVHIKIWMLFNHILPRYTIPASCREQHGHHSLQWCSVHSHNWHAVLFRQAELLVKSCCWMDNAFRSNPRSGKWIRTKEKAVLCCVVCILEMHMHLNLCPVWSQGIVDCLWKFGSQSVYMSNMLTKKITLTYGQTNCPSLEESWNMKKKTLSICFDIVEYMF